MPRVKGTIELLVDGTDDLPALKNSVVNYSTDPITAANIANLGWTNSTPNMSNWTASVGGNILIDGEGKFNATQALLESYAFAKTSFVIKFSAANGETYVGYGFVSSYRLVSADQSTFGFVAEIRGSGDLITIGAIDGGGTTPPSWCPGITYLTHYWSSPHPVTGDLWMGTAPGWVKVKDFQGGFGSAGGDLYGYYGDTLVFFRSEFGTWCGGGGGEEYFYYYDPDPGGPYTMWFDQYITGRCGIPFGSECRISVFCPGVYEPTT